MRVQISVVGIHPRPDIPWPEGWPPPRVGEEIDILNRTLFVRTVVWYPFGNAEGGSMLQNQGSEPFVYVVAGTERAW